MTVVPLQTRLLYNMMTIMLLWVEAMPKRSFAIVAVIVLCVVHAAVADPLTCNLDRYRPTAGLIARVSVDALEIAWASGRAEEARLQFGIDGGTPVIREIAVRRGASKWSVLASGVTPEFRIVTGLRRVTNQQLKPLRQLGIDIMPAVVDETKWEAFWDAPLQIPAGAQAAGTVPPKEGIAGQPGLPRRPEEINRASAAYDAHQCEVRTNGARLEVAFPGVDLGIFPADCSSRCTAGSASFARS